MVAEQIVGAGHSGGGGVGGGGRRQWAAQAAPRLDTRLIAAVQSRAGGRVHEAANLLQAYYGWNDELAAACATGDADAVAEAERAFRSAAVRLRQFLYSLSAAAHILV
jgi:hypothetical protein